MDTQCNSRKNYIVVLHYPELTGKWELHLVVFFIRLLSRELLAEQSAVKNGILLSLPLATLIRPLADLVTSNKPMKCTTRHVAFISITQNHHYCTRQRLNWSKGATWQW
jgi:hypothetical protein